MEGPYDIGEVVYSREYLYNDGGIPDVPESALLCRAGARGVVVRTGHVEADRRTLIYLVRFEGEDLVLGPPVGCLQEELTQAPAGEPA